MRVVDKDRWRILSPHLDSGLELTGEPRLAWLAVLRAEDPALAAEVEALLDQHSALEREGFLAGEPPPRPEPAPAAPLPPIPPDRIGPYRILRELGRGGMGCVYLAEQEGQDFRRLLALKVVEPGGPGAEVERRFRDERRILAGLEHPGIARFYDAGRGPDGRWFLALEYVEGLNLHDHARERGLTTEQKVRLVLEVLEAVAFAHGHGVVHRDLKPSNILVGADGRPRLLDFGIAKLIDADLEASTTQTRTEFRALTPAYASPEQFRGERATAASDVFSLGVVLYELVAGVRPFAASSTSRAALERAVLTDDPDPPSTASRRAAQTSGRPPLATRPLIRFRSKDAALGRDLDAICLKALRKEPAERYASAASFANDLRCSLEGRPVAARAGSRHYRLARLARRHGGRLATYAALGVAAAMVVVAASAYRRAERMRAPAPPAPRAFPYSDVGTIPIEELQRRFAEEPASVEAGAALALGLTSSRRAQEAQLIVARLRQIPGREQDPLIDYADARIAVELREPQRALVLFTRARDGALAGGRGELLAQVRATRGRLLATLGELDEATSEMELARADFVRAGDSASLSPVLSDLAIGHLQRGEMAHGESLLEEALSAASKVGRRPVVVLLNLAALAVQRGRPDLAEPKYREGRESYRRSGDRRREGEAARDLSEVLRDLGRSREADGLIEESIALLRTTRKEPGLAAALFVRGAADLAGARLDRIAATVGEMENVAQDAVDKRALGLAHHLRGRAAAARGDLQTARRHFGEGSRLLVANADRDLAGEMDLAWSAAEHAAGDPNAARRVLDDALAKLGGGAGTLAGFFAETLRARIEAEGGGMAAARRRLEALGEDTARSPSASHRLAFLTARAALATAESRFDEARRDLESARGAADQAGRKLDFLSIELDLADVDRRAGDPVRAATAARAIAAEARALQLQAIVARATAFNVLRRARG